MKINYVLLKVKQKLLLLYKIYISYIAFWKTWWPAHGLTKNLEKFQIQTGGTWIQFWFLIIPFPPNFLCGYHLFQILIVIFLIKICRLTKKFTLFKIKKLIQLWFVAFTKVYGMHSEKHNCFRGAFELSEYDEICIGRFKILSCLSIIVLVTICR